MLHTETVSGELLSLLKVLCSMPQLGSFRLVGGTAIALHLGHRKSVDIDLFSNEKLDKSSIRKALNTKFPATEIFVTEHNLIAEINGVRVELYDDWIIPFRRPAMVEEGIRLATLEDLAALKLSAITGRREKKDYIDLYYLFNSLNALDTLKNFKEYDPLLSMKSILFALGEVTSAEENKSPMPDMIVPLDWEKVDTTILKAAKDYLKEIEQQKR